MNATPMTTPSRSAILKAAAVALAVAVVLLFTIVLPAEYGYDPLGTGARLGLTAIASAGADPEPARVVQGAITPESRIFKYDSQDFLLRPGDGMEMKYHLKKGSTMLYAWKADGVLEFEFHGEPDQKPSKDYYESYELDKTGKDASYGTFVAPSTGIHGWYFKNNSDRDIRFHLNVAGFIDGAKMYAGGPGEEVPVEDAP